MSSNDPNVSCLNCPSLLEPTDRFFNKGVGTKMCARFGKPIGRITSSDKEVSDVARHFASNCDQYGKPKPATPDWDRASFQVMLPDPKVIGAFQEQPNLVNSCAGCKYFIREDVVAKDLGWTAPLCAQKGKLLLANRHTLEARHCEVKDFGSVRLDTEGMTFLPEYEEGFAGAADPIKAHKKAMENFVDPSEYETDKPVSSEEEAGGIRAWRAITDPATENTVYLPVYRSDYFTDEELKKVPSTGDDEHPEDYVDHGFYVYKTAVLWTELDETPALWGVSGTGKTEFFRHMAWLMQIPFERISITGSSELDELFGTTHYTEGVGTHFEDGRLVKAWSKACVLVIDEPNAGPPDVWQAIRPMTDNSKQLVVDADDGRTRDRHQDCYLGMAMNPAWDIMNVGTHMIGDADVNRLMHMFIELPPAELEKEIIKKRCEHDGWAIPAEMLETVMLIAADIRALTTHENQTLALSWAIRPQLKVARALRWFDFLTAYKMAAADYLEPQAQETLLNVVRSHVEN